MNRKELGCAVVGMLAGAAGCSASMKSLVLPDVGAAEEIGNGPDAAAVNPADLSAGVPILHIRAEAKGSGSVTLKGAGGESGFFSVDYIV